MPNIITIFLVSLSSFLIGFITCVIWAMSIDKENKK